MRRGLRRCTWARSSRLVKIVPCEHAARQCEPCRKARSRARAEQWRLANLDRVRATGLRAARKRFAADPEGQRAYSRERQRRFRAFHPEVVRARERAAYPQKRSTLGFRFSNFKCTARRRGLSVALTVDQYASVIAAGACTYCDGALPVVGSGLDRIDNGRGYSIDNVVPCCTACNSVRGDRFSHEEMLILGVAVRVILSRRVREVACSKR